MELRQGAHLPERMDERLSWPIWLHAYSGRFTHINGYPQLQVRCRPVKVRRSETDVLPLSYTANQMFM